MKYIIDRFEECYAVCEDEHGNMINIERKLISKSAVEGDIIYESSGRYLVDSNAAKIRKMKISELTKDLWKE